MSNFVTVPRAAFDTIAKNWGFTAERRGNELVYVKVNSTNPNVRCLLFTSVAHDGQVVRGKGDDAIRVGVLYEKPGDQKGSWLYFRRVFRVTSVESVVNRTKLALLEGAKKAQQMLKRPCPKCGAPTYDDSGRCIVQACREGVSTPKAQAKSKSAKRWPRRGKGRAVAPVQAPIMQEEVTHEPTDAELELLMDEEAQYAMASLADDVADGRLQQDEAQVASMIRGQF
jgi:uncharacterized Zn finger protein (UPF0148 family)